LIYGIAFLCVGKSPSVDSFERNVDKFWCSQDGYYNYKATTTELETEVL